MYYIRRQMSLMWNKLVSCGTEQSHVGQSSLTGTEQSHRVQSSLKWERAVSCGTEQANVGQSSLIGDRTVS